jgi:DeoR/GlpR family transcriptional regulator of sugar metabolism
MLPIERKNAILARLVADGKVIVSDLALEYGVTEETIRRDLDKLEKEGLAQKTYGGAVKKDNLNVELPINVRKQTNVEGKKYIADIIGKMISDGDYLLLDSSTTALFTVKSIAERHNITLLTNSIEVLLELPQTNDWRVICTGGEFMTNSLSFAGRQVESIIDEYHVDLCVISCKGLDMEKGITDTRDFNATIKKAFMRSAKKVILAVDNTKFDKTSFVRFANIGEIDAVITDKEPSDEWKNYFASNNVELYY